MTSDEVTWIGTIFSILGAGIAIWQAWAANTSAKKAKEIENKIHEKYSQYENAQLRNELLSVVYKINELRGNTRSSVTVGRTLDKSVGTVRNVLNDVMSRKIYDVPEVKKAVDDGLRSLDKVDQNNYQRVLGRINASISAVSRHIDTKVRE